MGFIRDNLAKALSWSEPAFVKRAERGVRFVPPWYHIIPAALFGVMVYIGFFVRPDTGDPKWGPFVAGAIMAGVSYLLPIVNAASGASISITAAAITRMDHILVLQAPILVLFRVGIKEFKWTDIHRCTLIENDQIARRAIRVLELYGKDEELLMRIGLPPKKPTTEKLLDCISRNGRELVVVGGDHAAEGAVGE